MFSSYRRLDCYSLLQQPLPGVNVHVVRAEHSDRWSAKELQQLGEAAEQSGTASVSTNPHKPHTLAAQEGTPGVQPPRPLLGLHHLAAAHVTPCCE